MPEDILHTLHDSMANMVLALLSINSYGRVIVTVLLPFSLPVVSMT